MTNGRIAEMIDELDGFLHRGERLYPIDLAIDASEVLFDFVSHHETRADLEAWIGNADPELPLWLCETTLAALRDVAGGTP